MPRGKETIFAKIVRGEVPAKTVLETEQCLAFHDLSPQAPVHVLIIPKESLINLTESNKGDASLLGSLLLAANEVAKTLGVIESGYRIVINNGRDAGQTVDHLHLHLLAGRPMKWPPG
jgi:histidine triad (HIT) family protein